MNYHGKEEFKKKFQGYSKFRSKKAFNNHMEMFLADCKSTFTQSEFIAFRRLTKYAANAFGVAYVKIDTLLKAIKKYDRPSGVSKRTFHRMREKAENAGILTTVKSWRSNGFQAANVWIFCPYIPEKKTNGTLRKDEFSSKPDSDKHVLDPQMAPPKPSNQSKTNNIKKRKANEITKDNFRTSSKKKSKVPEAFRCIVSPYLASAKVIGEFWRMAQHFNRKSPMPLDHEGLIKLSVMVFRKIQKKLKGGSIGNAIAYFNGTFKRCLEPFLLKQLQSRLAAAGLEGNASQSWEVAGRLKALEQKNALFKEMEEERERRRCQYSS